MIFAGVLILSALVYGIFICRFTRAWTSLPIQYNNANFKPAEMLSVIVAARNEANRIPGLLKALARQDYPKNLFEVIIVDDHSDDNTVNEINAFLEKHPDLPFKLLKSKELEKPQGKKHALNAGIKKARGNYIITTDADCHMGSRWLASIASCISLQQPEMIIGPVLISGENGFFQKLQVLEFLSLQGSTGGAAALSKPIMCNGANLAFKKDVFLGANGYEHDLHLVSGDDMFLMHRIKEDKTHTICYLKNLAAVVYTSPEKSLKGFFRQRGRWAGKFRDYSDPFTFYTALVVGTFSLLLLIGLASLPWQEPLVRWVVAGAWLFKGLVDFPLLFSAAGFFRKKKLLVYYFPAFVLYPFYATASVFAGLRTERPWR